MTGFPPVGVLCVNALAATERILFMVVILDEVERAWVNAVGREAVD